MYISKSIIYFILYLFIFHKTIVNSEQSYYRVRNIFLRIYIANEKTRPQIINEYSNKLIQKFKIKAKQVYYKFVNKCYDINMRYCNLTDEEKEFMEFIISLCN